MVDVQAVRDEALGVEQFVGTVQYPVGLACRFLAAGEADGDDEVDEVGESPLTVQPGRTPLSSWMRSSRPYARETPSPWKGTMGMKNSQPSPCLSTRSAGWPKVAWSMASL